MANYSQSTFIAPNSFPKVIRIGSHPADTGVQTLRGIIEYLNTQECRLIANKLK